MLVHNVCPDYPLVVLAEVERFFFTGIGGSFGFRFNLSLKARCALRPGEGPRAFGFSMVIFSRCTAFVPAPLYQLRRSAKRRQNNSLTHWRGRF